MTRTILITGANNGIGLALTKSMLDMGDRVAALDLSLENLPGTSNLLPFVCNVTDPHIVGRGLAKLVGKTRPMLAAGFVNNLQLWMSYHLRVPMARLMSSLAEKARQNQERNTIATSARQN